MRISTPIYLLIVTFCAFNVSGCDWSMGENARRVALKEGLKAAREAQAFKGLKVNESPDSARLRNILSAVLESTIKSSTRTRFDISIDATIPLDGDEGFHMRDRIVVTMETPDRWHVSHTTEWRADGQARNAGRRCTQIGDRFLLGGAHGPMTEIRPQAREDESCLKRSIGSITELISPIADHISSTVTVADTPAGQSALLRIKLRGQQSDEPLPIPLSWSSEMSDVDAPARMPRGHLFAERGRIESMSGDLFVQPETSQLVSGQLQSQFRINKASRDIALKVDVRVDSSPFSDQIVLPEEILVATERPRIFKAMKDLLGLDAKESAQPSLPKPGDAPRLKMGSDGRLSGGSSRGSSAEDQPLPGRRPETVIQDEDIPR